MQLGTLLDVAIVLVAVYAGLSCVCSFVNEQIAGFLSLRGEKLFTGVLNLVSGNRALADTIFKHPLVDSATNDDRGLIRNRIKENRPSYLDPRNFSLAFWHSIESGASDPVLTTKEASARALQANKVLTDAEAALTQANTDAASAKKAADTAVSSNAPGADDAVKAAAAAAAKAKTAAEARDKAQSAVNAAAKVEDAATKSDTAAAKEDEAAQKSVDAKKNPTNAMAQADATAAAAAAATARKDADAARAMLVSIVDAPKEVIDSLRQAAAAIPDAKLKASVAALLNQAGADYGALLKSTDDWFNSQMDRVSGWYRRQSQYIVIVIAFAIVVLSGIDSIEIAQRFYTSPVLLDATTESIKKAYASQTAADGTANEAKIRTAAQNLVTSKSIQQFFHPFGSIPTRDDVAADQNAATAAKAGVAQKTTEAAAATKAKTDADNVVKQDKAGSPGAAAHKTAAEKASTAKDSADKALADAKVAAVDAEQKLAIDTAGATITRPMRWLGMFVTILALSLGGPFWFDMLGKLVNVRAAGAKPDESPKKQTA